MEGLSKQVVSLRDLYNSSRDSTDVQIAREVLSKLTASLSSHLGNTDEVCMAVASRLPELVDAEVRNTSSGVVV